MTHHSDLVSVHGLTISRFCTDQAYVLLWQGESTLRAPSELLTPALESVLSEEALRDRKLVLDFSSMTFMNSSTVAPIIDFVKNACSQGIAVHLIYNIGVPWQRTTASAMRMLTHVLKCLTVEASSPSPQ